MDESGFRNTDRLRHIIEAIERIESFCRNISEKKFLSDDMINSSVLYQFLIIGEAIRHVDNQLLNRYKYPWHLPRSFRNYIAHEYFGINLKQVYKTVKELLPEFKILVQKIIEDESK
jgi:uncharacterized protein with HEPN domain